MPVVGSVPRSVARGIPRLAPDALFGGGSGAFGLLESETNGFAADFTNSVSSLVIKDLTTMSNNWNSANGNVQTFWKDRSFTSYTGATATGKVVRNASGYYLPASHNLIQMSERFDAPYWTKNNSTVATTVVANPLGTGGNAQLWDDGVAVTVAHQIATASTVTAITGIPFTASWYVKSISMPYVQILFGSTGYGTESYANFDISTGVVGTVGTNARSSIASLGNGWYRVSCTAFGTGNTGSSAAVLQVITSATAIRGETFTGTNRQAYVWGAMLNAGSSALDYAATTAHNLCLQSQVLGTTWTPGAATVGSNVTTAPDGTTTADSIIENGTAAVVHRLFQTITIVAGSTNTFSVYLKYGGTSARRWVALSVNTVADGTEWFGATFDLVNGTISHETTGSLGTFTDSTMEDVGNGWYRCSVTGIVGTATSVYGIISLSDGTLPAAAARGSPAYDGDGVSLNYAWGAQLELASTPGKYVVTTTAAVYSQYFALPIEYNASGVAQGILVEEARTNLVTYSNSPSNGVWSKSAAAVTANSGTAPSGITEADFVYEDGTTAGHLVFSANATLVSGTTYCFSAFVKKPALNGNNAVIMSVNGAGVSNVPASLGVNLVTGAAVGSDTGSAGNKTISDAGNGWYRISFTIAATASAAANLYIYLSKDGVWANRSYAGDGASGTLVWGAQIEAGTFPTSPIATGSATVTRAGDTTTLSNKIMPNSDANVTLYLKVVKLGPSGADYSAGLVLRNSETALQNRIDIGVGIGRAGAGGATRIDVLSANVNVAAIGSVTAFVPFAVGSTYKAAVSCALDDFASQTNGLELSVDTSGAMPTTPNLLEIGCRSGATIGAMYIQQVMSLPVTKSDDDILTLTT